MTVKFILKMFIGLLSVFLIDLNTAGLKYYPFIFTIDKCNRSSNTIRKKNVCKKADIWNLSKYACENGSYLGSTIDNLVICDKIIETTKTVPTKKIPTNFNDKKVIYKIKKLYI